VGIFHTSALLGKANLMESFSGDRIPSHVTSTGKVEIQGTQS